MFKSYTKEEWIRTARELLDFIEGSADIIPGGMVGLTVANLAWDKEEYEKIVSSFTDQETTSDRDDDSEFTKALFGPHTLLVFWHPKEAA